MNIFEYCNRFPLVKIPDNTILYEDWDKIEVKNISISRNYIMGNIRFFNTLIYDVCCINHCRIPPKTAIVLLGKVL